MVGVEAGQLTMDRNAKGRPAAVVIAGGPPQYEAGIRLTAHQLTIDSQRPSRSCAAIAPHN